MAFTDYLNPVNWFYEDPSKAAMPYLESIPGQTGKYFEPYIQQGREAYGTLNPIYQQLLQHPGAEVNRLGSEFKQSPGYDFALKQALGAANRGFAAGGMAGSPMAAQENMRIATGLADQDYYNYLNKVLGLYGKGLEGEEGFYNKGYGASTSMADMIAQALASEAQLQYSGTQQKNQFTNNLISSILGNTGSAGGAAIGKIL
jgi:hypothetical protein